MPYVKKTIKAGVTIEIKKYFTSKYKAKGIKEERELELQQRNKRKSIRDMRKIN